MRLNQSAAVVAVLAAVAWMGSASRGAVLTTPSGVVSSFDHTYLVGGKGTVATTIQDQAVLMQRPTWAPTWRDPVTWITTLAAPEGYEFAVTPAVGFGQPTQVSVDMSWQVSWPVTDHTVFFGTTSYAFEGFAGTTPAIVLSSSVVGQGAYLLSARATFNATEPFSFASLTFTTTPSFSLEAFPAETYLLASSTLSASLTGDGSLPDMPLVSLRPVPEPAGIAVLGSLWLLGLSRRRRSSWRWAGTARRSA